MDKTEINCSAKNHKSLTNINNTVKKPSILQELVQGVIWSARRLEVL